MKQSACRKRARSSQLAWWCAGALLLGTLPIAASTIGKNPPAQPITQANIDRLPASERGVWLAYLDRSERQRQADKDFFAAELKRSGLALPLEPPHGNSARSIPLDREPSWYASVAARHIAAVIVSFQTPAGGWGKNMDMTGDVRRPGEKFAPNNLSRFLSPGDFDTPREPDWNYIGTIDNDATTTELQYLAKVITAAGPQSSQPYRAAFLRGIQYLLDAQFPNGGWPQVWPLEGGYHDAITYNDDAMIETMEVLRDTAEGQKDFAFVPKSVRDRAAASFARGVQCILATQIRSHGVLTVWPQQDAPLTLQPESGRNFEPPAQSASESADVLLLLMNDLPHPDAAERQSIRAAAAWFRKTAIYGEKWERTPNGRELVSAPGAGPIWARYYQVGTDQPIFADRDKTIHDNVADLSLERRNGYAWYSSSSRKALDRFAQWSAANLSSARQPTCATNQPCAEGPMPSSISAQPGPLMLHFANETMERWPDGRFAAPGSPWIWNYELGVLLDGMDAVWKDTGNPRDYQYIRDSIDPFLGPGGTIQTYKAEENQLDNILPGRQLLLLYRTTHDPRYAQAAAVLYRQLLRQPRTPSGGFWHKQRYPNQMWLDGLYMAEPFYAEYASQFHHPEAFRDITRQFALMQQHALDPSTGLLYHGWDESKQQRWANPRTGTSSQIWARGMGWYLMALVDTLPYYPAHDPARETLLTILRRDAAAAVRYQDAETGLWYQVMDKAGAPGNYPESSASCMFVYALAKGVRLGYLPKSYLGASERGYRGIVSRFVQPGSGDSLNLTGTVKAAGLGGNPYRDGSYQYYLSEKVVTNDPKGIGAFLLASAELAKTQASHAPSTGVH